MYRPPWMEEDDPPTHDLGYWVETREDALKESYYLHHWYKNSESEARHVLTQLAKTLDQTKEEKYVDEEYVAKHQRANRR